MYFISWWYFVIMKWCDQNFIIHTFYFSIDNDSIGIKNKEEIIYNFIHYIHLAWLITECNTDTRNQSILTILKVTAAWIDKMSMTRVDWGKAQWSTPQAATYAYPYHLPVHCPSSIHHQGRCTSILDHHHHRQHSTSLLVMEGYSGFPAYEITSEGSFLSRYG